METRMKKPLEIINKKSNTAQNYYIDIEDKIDDEELEEDMFRKFDDERQTTTKNCSPRRKLQKFR